MSLPLHSLGCFFKPKLPINQNKESKIMSSFSNVPPSQRKALSQSDYAKRQQTAKANAARINRNNKREQQRVDNSIKDAKDKLESRTLPPEDIMYYVAASKGMTLEDYQYREDRKFDSDLDKLLVQAKNKIRGELQAAIDANELSLERKFARSTRKR